MRTTEVKRVHRRGRRAAVSLLAGVGLVGASFALPAPPASADNGWADLVVFAPVQPDARYGDPVTFQGHLSDQSVSCNTVLDCDPPTGTVFVNLTGPGGSTQLSGPTTPDPDFDAFSNFSIPLTTPLPAGDYSADVFFDGDFTTGYPDGLLFSVGTRPCATTLTQSVADTATNGAVTFTADVSTTSAAASGTVQFFQEAGATDVLLDSKPVVAGVNTATSANVGTLLPAGPTDVYAVYSGDAQHQGPCTSNVLTHTVAAVAPPSANPDTVITPRGQAVSFSPLANDVAGGAGPLTGLEVLGAGTADGELTATGSTLTYTPEDGFVGDDSFDYFAYDDHGGQSAPAHVNIVVSCDAVASADAYETPSGQPLTIDAAAGVLANDDTCGEQITVDGGPTHGTLTAIDRAEGGFTYTPALGYFGVDSFSYTYNSGLAVTARATVAIQVLPPTGTTTTTTAPDTSTSTSTTTTSTSTTAPAVTTTTAPVDPTTSTSTTAPVDPTTSTSTTTAVDPTTSTTSTAPSDVGAADLGGSGGGGSTVGPAPTDGTLPRTGTDARGPIALAGALLAVGAVLHLLATRRRPAR